MNWFLVVVLSVVLNLANCNFIPIKGRIIGGRVAKIEEYPFQISLRLNGRHLCGGTIISADSILTAAHCTIRYKPTQLTIAHGATIANNGIVCRVVKIIQNNPIYDINFLENDVSILKIDPPIEFTNSSRPIGVSSEHLADGSEVIVSGWGRRKISEPKSVDFGSRSLKAATLYVSNIGKCSKIYKEFGVDIDERRICAAAQGRDSCQGDSGGPLIDKKTGKLVAVLSFGFGCANEKYPGVYTRASSYLEFIKQNM